MSAARWGEVVSAGQGPGILGNDGEQLAGIG